MSKYIDMPIIEINKLLKNGTIKPIDLVNECFSRIENKDLNAFITLDKENAIKKAKELEGQPVDNLLFGIPIALKDTGLEESLGTIVRNRENLENVEISGIAKDDNISRITVMGLENKIGKTYKVFKLLAEHKINVDMIVQSFGESINKNISFTIKTTDLAETMQILEKNLEYLTAKEIIHYENLSKVSIVGIGMTDRTGIASKMFEALYEKNINMHLISTSEIKVTVLVNQDEADEAVKSIHDKFFKE